MIKCYTRNCPGIARLRNTYIMYNENGHKCLKMTELDEKIKRRLLTIKYKITIIKLTIKLYISIMYYLLNNAFKMIYLYHNQK